MISADLHVHTQYSPDASIPTKTIVEQLHAHPFIKAIAITDHNTVKGYYKAQELASEYKDILIIPGVEITTVEGDLIVLGVAELPPEPWTVQNVIDFAKENKALIIIAHPYRTRGLGDAARNYEADAIEVINGVSSPEANRTAENLAEEMNLPGVAGSDAHQVNELWTAYTEVQAFPDSRGILEAIKKGLVKAKLNRKPCP
jgi:predicted metal-dependent phosphoesterase TrpH